MAAGRNKCAGTGRPGRGPTDADAGVVRRREECAVAIQCMPMKPGTVRL